MSTDIIAPIDPDEWIKLAKQVIADPRIIPGPISRRRAMPRPTSGDHFLSLREAWCDTYTSEVGALLNEVGSEADRTVWAWSFDAVEDDH